MSDQDINNSTNDKISIDTGQQTLDEEGSINKPPEVADDSVSQETVEEKEPSEKSEHLPAEDEKQDDESVTTQENIMAEEHSEKLDDNVSENPTASIDATTADSVSVQGQESTNSQTQAGEEETYTHPMDELTDQQVIELVQELEAENRHLYLENVLFESFLRENDPTSLDSLEEVMKHIMHKESSVLITEKESIEKTSSMTEKGKFKIDSYTSVTSIAEGKGPKLNISQKTDMIMRSMEESQTSLEAFLKKCNITKRNLKAELEEFSIREAEIKEASEIFEFNVVIQGLDKLTQRIPAEKFIRYMEEWLKSAQLQIEKLRLRIATLKVQYKKVSQQLIQRQELGENVHAVDFDQLEIENKHFIEKIEQKNMHLLELKKMNGGANLILSMHKKILQKQQEECNKLKIQIAETNRQIDATENECNQAEEELKVEIERFENCKNLKNQYTVPEVIEYVRLKDKLHDVKKNIKVWARRKKIQDIALSTCLREMKNLTGMSEIDSAWFEEMQSLSEISEESGFN